MLRFDKAFLLRLSGRASLLALQVLAILLLANVIVYLAGREPSFPGVIAIFLLLAFPSATFLIFSGRILSTSLAIAGALFAVERIDAKKYGLMNEHLHAFDLLTIWEYSRGGNF